MANEEIASQVLDYWFAIEFLGQDSYDAFCTLWRSQMRFRAVALRSITAARF